MLKPASQEIRNKIIDQCPWAKGNKIEKKASECKYCNAKHDSHKQVK